MKNIKYIVVYEEKNVYEETTSIPCKIVLLKLLLVVNYNKSSSHNYVTKWNLKFG